MVVVTETALARYEGLVRATAQRLCYLDEFEDIAQLLRIKVLKALRAYDPERARGLAQDNYVFMCVRDMAKDVAARKRLSTSSLQELRERRRPPVWDVGLKIEDWFDGRFCRQYEEDALRVVFDQDYLPDTLTGDEEWVARALGLGLKQAEIARGAGVDVRRVEVIVRHLRVKLAHLVEAS